MREYSEGAYIVSRSSRRTAQKRRIGGAGLLVGALIILTAGICLLVVFLPRQSAPSASGVGFSGKTFYLLTVGDYDTHSDASLAARDAMNKGGAGYIFNDGKYRIVAAVYEREADAAALASVNADAHYFALELPAAKLDEQDRAALDYAVGEWFSAVYSAATELDRGNSTEAEAELAAINACRTLDGYAERCSAPAVVRAARRAAAFDYLSQERTERSALSYLRFLTVRAVTEIYFALS